METIPVNPVSVLDFYCELCASFEELATSLDTALPASGSKTSILRQLYDERAYLVNALCAMAYVTPDALEQATGSDLFNDQSYRLAGTISPFISPYPFP